MYDKINKYYKEIYDDLGNNDEYTLIKSSKIYRLMNSYLNYIPDIKLRRYPYKSISGLDNLELVRTFLKQFHLNNDFYELFRNGTIEFKNIYEDYEDEYHDEKWCSCKDEHLIYVPNNGNIADSRTLIHEFFHYITSANTFSYYFLAEFISIYFELKYVEYLNNFNYEKNDLLRLVKFRFDSCYRICDRYEFKFFLLDLYSKLGPIEESTIKLYNEKIDISLFNEELAGLNLDKYNDYSSYRYVIGTLLATYALNQNINPLSILKIGYCLNSNVEVNDLLKTIGIDINNKDINAILIDNCKEYLTKTIKQYNSNKEIR